MHDLAGLDRLSKSVAAGNAAGTGCRKQMVPDAFPPACDPPTSASIVVPVGTVREAIEPDGVVVEELPPV
jgi:hypothetical protein